MWETSKTTPVKFQRPLSRYLPSAAMTEACSVARAFLVAIFLTSAHSVEFPSFLKRCSINDPNLEECFEKAANDALPKLKGGFPSLGVPPMDPIEIPRIYIKQSGNERMSFDILFENCKFYNVSHSTIKTKLDLKKNVLAGSFDIPHTKLVSDYEVTGRLLLVPIRGKGKAYIDIFGSKANFTLKVLPKVIKGKSYYFMDSLAYQIVNAEKMKMRFTNLLGNRALGESINVVLNENWEDLYESVRPSFQEVFRAYFFDLGKRVFNKIPLDQIFPENL